MPILQAGAFAACDMEVGDVVERGIARRLTDVDGNVNPYTFTWCVQYLTSLPSYNTRFAPLVVRTLNTTLNARSRHMRPHYAGRRAFRMRLGQSQVAAVRIRSSCIRPL
eukprot:SAG31_NODE_5198_length_2682_cov_1.861789_3_plen_108_part_01